MALQQGQELDLERLRKIVFPLILNIGGYVRDVRFTYSERTVAVLPRKFAKLGEFGMNPGGGTAFDQMRGLRRSHRARSTQEKMNVIINTADLQWLHVILPWRCLQDMPKSVVQSRA